MAGQVFDNNAATGTPIAVVNYTANTNIIVNGNDGSAGDTDSLTLRGTDPANPGTSGNDNFDIDLTRAGMPGTRRSASPTASACDPAVQLAELQQLQYAQHPDARRGGYGDGRGPDRWQSGAGDRRRRRRGR